jgi:hypothetical protein
MLNALFFSATWLSVCSYVHTDTSFLRSEAVTSAAFSLRGWVLRSKSIRSIKLHISVSFSLLSIIYNDFYTSSLFLDQSVTCNASI